LGGGALVLGEPGEEILDEAAVKSP